MFKILSKTISLTPTKCLTVKHQSNASVQVMLFRDRLEVWNPGALPYGLTVQKLHGPHKSLPTNPLLADPMYWNGYIEKVGTGTEDIITKCHDYGLQTPEFHQEEDFRVVIWRNKSDNDPDVIQTDPDDVRSDVRNDVRNVESTIGKEESVILNMMRSNPSVTAMLISQELKLSLRSIQRYMTSLREKGLIRREGSTKRGKWIVIKKE